MYAFGPVEIDLVYAGLMAALTAIALFFVFAGGQITIMLTDFVQGTFANICLSIIVLFLLFTVPWSKIEKTIGQRDAKEFSPVTAVETGEDYSRIEKLGEEGTKRSEKYIRAPLTRMAFGADGSKLEVAASQKGTKTPETILFAATPKEKLLSGTDYEAKFSYRADDANQYSMIVLSRDGRQESQNLVLPGTGGEAREVVVPFKSTNIGSAELFFAKAGDAPLRFSLTAPVAIEQKGGQSMFHPFQSGSTKDFNFFFFLIQALVIFWTYKAWQGTQGYYSAAINAHEARMGGVVGNLRIMVQNMMVLFIPIAAYAVLFDFGDPQSRVIAAEITEKMAALPNEAMQNQLRTTLVLTKLLPVGLIGAFSAVMMAAFIGTNGTYMHSWGSIFVQDIYMPLRRKKATLTAQEHFKVLRWAIAGVGIFAFFFSLFFEQNSAILMYFALTGTIWLGGAGAVIALGLYWKRGTTQGAYASILTGMVVAIVAFICQQPYGWMKWYGVEFPLNYQHMMLVAMLASTSLYVVVSLVTCRKPFNMDRLLHRGEYATEDSTEKARQVEKKKRRTLAELIGIDKDFSFLDKILYTFVSSWSFIVSGVFLIGLALNKTGVVKLDHWKAFWHLYVLLSVGLGIITTIWFTIGGCVDLADLLRRLKHRTRDEHDDGSVEKKPGGKDFGV
jgi:Na+/proline symporter